MELKTNHAQSRARLSYNTHSSTDPGFIVPLEICFKLKTDRCLQALKIPDQMSGKLTTTSSPKGSYRREQFLLYSIYNTFAILVIQMIQIQ